MLKRKVQGMLGRAGPFPVAEDVQYVQGVSPVAAYSMSGAVRSVS